MFSGIVETMAQIVKIEQEQTNKHFTLRNPYGEPLKIDQSIAHNGVSTWKNRKIPVKH